MGFYGVLPKENLSIQESMIPVYECGSICMQEYHNKLMMYESCTSDNERSILESQIYLLQEMSIRDIWEKIKGFFARIIEAIKKFFIKVKDFFTGAKIKELKKRCQDLEKKVEEQEREIKDKEREIKIKDQHIEVEENKAKMYEDLYNNFANSSKENLESYKKYFNIVSEICNKFVQNKYIYFDPFDYLQHDCEKCMASLESKAQDLYRSAENNKYDEFNKDEESWITEDEYKNIYIIDPKIYKNNPVINGDSGGDTQLSSVIDKDLDEKLDKSPLKDKSGTSITFIKFAYERLDRFDNTSFSTLILNISRAAENINKTAGKIFGEMNTLKDDSENDKYTTDDPDRQKRSARYEELKFLYKQFTDIGHILQLNCTYASIINGYSEKAITTIKSFVNSVSAVYGMDKIKQWVEKK